jgi:cytochrome P450
MIASAELPPVLSGLPVIAEKLGIEVAGRNVAFLALAGYETTAHLIGSMVFLLSRNPSQWHALCADQELAGQAVSETLRLESPLNKVCRWAERQTELGGVELTAGQLIVLLIGAANRDPLRFSNPHEFVLSRPAGGHLAFGRGAHFCLGKALAELEATAVLKRLTERFTAIDAVEGGAAWMRNSSIRGLKELRVKLHARSAAQSTITKRGQIFWG